MFRVCIFRDCATTESGGAESSLQVRRFRKFGGASAWKHLGMGIEDSGVGACGALWSLLRNVRAGMLLVVCGVGGLSALSAAKSENLETQKPSFLSREMCLQ